MIIDHFYIFGSKRGVKLEFFYSCKIIKSSHKNVIIIINNSSSIGVDTI
nr:MAG TPA: hypothetical protein [Caudoviricetes sp.]